MTKWVVEIRDLAGDYSELDDVTGVLEERIPEWVVLNVWRDEEE